METKSCNDPVQMTPEEAVLAAEILKAVAHPLRLRILCVLSHQPCHVKGLAERLEVPSAIVSQQLRILRSAGMVAPTTQDGHAYYRIVEQHLYRMLNCLKNGLNQRAARGKI